MRKRPRMAGRKPHESGAMKHFVAADAGSAACIERMPFAGVPSVGDSAAQLNSALHPPKWILPRHRWHQGKEEGAGLPPVLNWRQP